MGLGWNSSLKNGLGLKSMLNQKVLSKVKTKLIGAGVRDPCGNACPGEAPRADRLRKWSAWRQRSNCTNPKNCVLPKFLNKTRLSLMFFHCNPYWIEEICDTPAELLASRDTAAARRGGLAGCRRIGSGFLKSTGTFSK